MPRALLKTDDAGFLWGCGRQLRFQRDDARRQCRSPPNRCRRVSRKRDYEGYWNLFIKVPGLILTFAHGRTQPHTLLPNSLCERIASAALRSFLISHSAVDRLTLIADHPSHALPLVV